jgi:hypothetical protein
VRYQKDGLLSLPRKYRLNRFAALVEKQVPMALPNWL